MTGPLNLDAAVFFLREGEKARHSAVVAKVRDDALALLEAIKAGQPMKVRGGGSALYFTPDAADRLQKAAAQLRASA